ncbi:MAG: hypothetical protein HXY34_12815 [Candidatus Thorarchaeota archaeon]|nr:hypothetical protein [Candidatus Thorarchaeota archaeon]
MSEKSKILFGFLLGTALSCAELVFGAFTILTMGRAAFFAVMLLTGVAAGSIKNGLLSGAMVLAAMIPVGLLIWPFMPHLGEPVDLGTIVVLIMIAMVGGPAWKIQEYFEGEPPAAVCCVGLIFLSLAITLAPLLYLGGLVPAAIGGALGRVIWDRLLRTSPAAPPSDSHGPPEPDASA